MNIQRFLQLVEAAQAVIDSDASDEVKWELLFPHLRREVDATGVDFESHDLDDGYGEEARRYVRDLQDKAAELQKLGAETIEKFDKIWA